MKNPYIETLDGYHKCHNQDCSRPALFTDTLLEVKFCGNNCYQVLKEIKSIKIIPEIRKCQNPDCVKTSIFYDDMLDKNFCSKECLKVIMDSLSFKSVIKLLNRRKK